VLCDDGDRLRTVFRTNGLVRPRLWARVYFEAKNMFEGLTMQELANNFYVSLDGELVKTVFEQNDRQWHWVAADESCDLKPGLHLITLAKQGLPVKVDQVVLYSGEDATREAWFRAPPPSSLPWGVAAAAEVARGGNWRAHAVAKLPGMAFVAEPPRGTRPHVKAELGPEPGSVDFVRVVGRADNAVRGDSTPCQQLSLWMHNSGQPLSVDVLYSDRHGECFLQGLHAAGAWRGWRLLAANIPLRLEGDETFFDKTGESADTVATPLVDAQGGPAALAGIRHAGGDRHATPDFPLEVRALRLVKPAGRAEVLFAEPSWDSPFTLRARLAG
jgi:hypothetical protein